MNAQSERSAFVTQAEFARLRGVSKAVVTKWKGQSILVVNEAGLVDVERTEWNLDQRPAKYRGGTTHRPVRAVPEHERPAAPQPRTPPPAAPPPPRPSDGFGAGNTDAPDPCNLPLADAVQRKENYLGLIREQAYRKGERELVDRALAEKLFFDTARDNRDAWLNWPARVATFMAEELGVDARTLTRVLTAHVHQHLTELGEPDAEFGDDDASGKPH